MKPAHFVLATCGLGTLVLLTGLTPSWAGPVVPDVTTVTTGGPCRAGIQTKNGTVTVPAGNILTNPAVASVTMTKPCAGAVTASFTAVVNAIGATQQVRVIGIAKCIGTGGFATHCTVGQTLIGSPDDTVIKDNGAAPQATHSAVFAWKGLKKGTWRFDIRATGTDNPSVYNRSLIVNAYNGG